MSDGPLLLRMSKAAELLDVSRAEMYRLVRQQHIRAVHVGAALRVPRIELERFIAERLAVEHGDLGRLPLEHMRGAA